MRLLVLSIVLALVTLLAWACEGDDSTNNGTTPGATSARTTQQPEATVDALGASPGPTGSGSTARARVVAVGQTYDYQGGRCLVGPGDEFLTVNIGDVAGDHYFALIAGRSPAADADTRSTQGGGDFSGDDVLITFRGEGNAVLLRSADTALTLAADLRSGEFTSKEATNSATVTGEFTC